MPYDVVVELRHAEDRQLIADCAEAYQPTTGSTHDLFVAPLGRLGYSGSRLYEVHFRDRRRPPYVIKTGPPEVMIEEGLATRAVRELPDGERAFLYPREEACQAILFPLVGKGNVITELSEMLYRSDDDTPPDPVKVLLALYEDLEQAHSTRPRSVCFGEEYVRYLHEDRDRGPYDALGEYFDQPLGEATVSGHRVRNPGRILKDVRRYERDVHCSLVHGDLHPRNVLLDGRGQPHLIDFAWGHHDGHWLKDFVLMETSIRFVEPPHGLLNQSSLREADRLLDEHEDGPAAVRALAGTVRKQPQTHRVLLEMADTVEVVRECARQRNPEYDYVEYVLATYLILMGGLRLPAYQHPRVLLSACRLADTLEERLPI